MHKRPFCFGGFFIWILCLVLYYLFSLWSRYCFSIPRLKQYCTKDPSAERDFLLDYSIVLSSFCLHSLILNPNHSMFLPWLLQWAIYLLNSCLYLFSSTKLPLSKKVGFGFELIFYFLFFFSPPGWCWEEGDLWLGSSRLQGWGLLLWHHGSGPGLLIQLYPGDNWFYKS